MRPLTEAGCAIEQYRPGVLDVLMVYAFCLDARLGDRGNRASERGAC